MAGYIPDQQQNTGSFIPTTQVWNTSEIYAADLAPELQELFVRMYQNLGIMTDVLNTKDFAFYLTQELVNSQSYYNPATNDQQTLRPVFRKIIAFGSLPPGETSLPHGLTANAGLKFTDVHGVANDNVGFNYYPLAGGSGSGTNNVEVNLDNTDVNIYNNTAITFTNCDVVLEYLKF
jgi:hypothetical protein